MALKAGDLPTSSGGTRSASGYAPGTGVLPIQLGTVSGDSAAGAGNQQSAPLVAQLADSLGVNKVGVDAQHALQVSSGGTTAVSVASATPGAVKSSAGRLCRVIITTLGTGSQVFYDNASAASGTILFATAASAPVGTIYDIQAPAVNGIYAAGAASTPVCTVLYS